jgi:phage terminase large subunit
MILDIRTPRVFKPLLYPSRYKGIYGGRGSGKSHFFAELAIERMIEKPTRICCAREIQKSLKQSVKHLLELKIEQMKVGPMFIVQEDCIKARNGSLAIFTGLQSHTSDSIKSLEDFDILWLEEAQNISNKSLTIARPTFRKPGSEIWASWNPNLATDPIDALLRGDTPPENAIVIEANYCDNPWFPDELKQELEYDKRRDIDKYNHVWLGKYRQNSEARVFRNWRIEDFTRPDGTIYRLGADWGFAVDPSVLIRCSIDGNNLYIDYEAYRVGCEIINLPELFMSVPDAEKWPITADSARPETISHMQKNGFPKIRSAVKGPKSIEDGIEWLKSFDIIVHPRCVHTIDELTYYSYKEDKLTGDILPLLEDKDNHVIDACIEGNSLISMRNGFKKIKDVQIGDEVLTRAGYRRVIDAGITGINQEVINIDGLWCTPDHKIWVDSKKDFFYSNTIRYDDSLLIDLEYTKWQLQRSKSLMAKPTLGILKALDHLTGITSDYQGKMGVQKFYTVKFGSIQTAKYRLAKSIISTILTGILQIMTSAILSLLPQKTMSISTLTTTGEISRANGWIALDTYLKNGTQAMKAKSSIKKLVRSHIKTMFPLRNFVKYAEKSLWLGRLADVISIVMPTAKQKHLEQETKRDVYNLTVENHHEYFANGILVKNCRYALEGARRAEANKVVTLKYEPKLTHRPNKSSWMR